MRIQATPASRRACIHLSQHSQLYHIPANPVKAFSYRKTTPMPTSSKQTNTHQPIQPTTIWHMSSRDCTPTSREPRHHPGSRHELHMRLQSTFVYQSPASSISRVESKRPTIVYPISSLQTPYLISRRKKPIKPPNNVGMIAEELQHAIDHCFDGDFLGFEAYAEVYEVYVVLLARVVGSMRSRKIKVSLMVGGYGGEGAVLGFVICCGVGLGWKGERGYGAGQIAGESHSNHMSKHCSTRLSFGYAPSLSNYRNPRS